MPNKSCGPRSQSPCGGLILKFQVNWQSVLKFFKKVTCPHWSRTRQIGSEVYKEMTKNILTEVEMRDSSGIQLGSAPPRKPEEEVNLKNFQITKLIGTGSFARVYLVKKLGGEDDGRFYAMKVVNKPTDSSQSLIRDHTIAEREILEKVVDMPFLATLFYAFQTPEKAYFILNFVQGGDLFTLLKQIESLIEPKLEEDFIKVFVAKITVTLEQLHSLGVVYRDLKAENVMLDLKGHPVLVDFGLSAKLSSDGQAFGYCGTVEYMAPEVNYEEPFYGVEVDWWSLGILVFELFSCRTPFRLTDDEPEDTVLNRIRDELPQFPPEIGDDAKDLIQKLLEKDPKRRFGAKDLKAHQFFKGVDWENLEAYEMPINSEVDGADDVRYFSKDFTEQEPVEETSNLLTAINFEGFAFVSPHVLHKPANKETSLKPKAMKWNNNRLTETEDFENFVGNENIDIGLWGKIDKLSNVKAGAGKQVLERKLEFDSTKEEVATKITKKTKAVKRTLDSGNEKGSSKPPNKRIRAKSPQLSVMPMMRYPLRSKVSNISITNLAQLPQSKVLEENHNPSSNRKVLSFKQLKKQAAGKCN